MAQARDKLKPFGIYYDPNLNINWLLDKNGPKSVVGLPKSACPFGQLWADKYCPHEFDLNLKLDLSSDLEEELDNNPVIQFLLPSSKSDKRILYLSAETYFQHNTMCSLKSVMSQELGIFHLTKGNYKTWVIQDYIRRSQLCRPFISLADSKKHSLMLPPILDCAAMEDSARIVIIGGEIPRYDYKYFVEFITVTNQMCEQIVKHSPNVLEAYGIKKIIQYMKTENIHNEESS